MSQVVIYVGKTARATAANVKPYPFLVRYLLILNDTFTLLATITALLTTPSPVAMMFAKVFLYLRSQYDNYINFVASMVQMNRITYIYCIITHTSGNSTSTLYLLFS